MEAWPGGGGSGDGVGRSGAKRRLNSDTLRLRSGDDGGEGHDDVAWCISSSQREDNWRWTAGTGGQKEQEGRWQRASWQSPVNNEAGRQRPQPVGPGPKRSPRTQAEVGDVGGSEDLARGHMGRGQRTDSAKPI